VRHRFEDSFGPANIETVLLGDEGDVRHADPVPHAQEGTTIQDLVRQVSELSAHPIRNGLEALDLHSLGREVVGEKPEALKPPVIGDVVSKLG
jgi:hypothetical protein